MDEVVALIVDLFELELQLEHVFHAVLQHRHRMSASARTFFRNSCALWGHQLVQHSVVVVEQLVQRLKILLFANVHGCNQIDGEVVALACIVIVAVCGRGRFGTVAVVARVGLCVANDGRLQSERVAVVVACQTQKLRRAIGRAILWHLGNDRAKASQKKRHGRGEPTYKMPAEPHGVVALRDKTR